MSGGGPVTSLALAGICSRERISAFAFILSRGECSLCFLAGTTEAGEGCVEAPNVYG
jgi:hypothetical protein